MSETYDEIFSLIKKKLNDPTVIYTLHDKLGEDHPTLSSGIATIDEVLSGGLPKGKIIEIFGSEASGKTTTALHFIAEAQKRGDIVYFIDAEHALDTQYASRIGVDFSKLMFSQPDTGEQALETIRVICEATQEIQEKDNKQLNTLIVVDSIPALIPKELFKIYQNEGLESSNALGAQARMLASKIPMIAAAASKAGATVVLINQERDKIGVTWGAKTTTPGGRAVKFFASLRAKVTRVGYYERAGVKAGIRSTLIPVKSKQFPIFNRVAEFVIGPNGIDPIAALVELLLKKKVVDKKGAWIKFNDRTWHGAAKMEDDIKSDDKLYQIFKEKIKESGGNTSPVELKSLDKSSSKDPNMLKPVMTKPVVAPPPVKLPSS